MGLAVAARVRAHAQAMAPLRRCVCPRRAVSAKAKLTFVDSLATSRLCHSAGAWDKLSRGQLDRMQATLVRGYRCAVSMPHRDPTRDRCANAEVRIGGLWCGKLGMSTRLALARLRLLGPVLLHGPEALLRLCDYLAARGRGWPSLIVGDLDLVHLHWGEGSLGAGAAAIFAWADLARCSPDVWERGFDRVERRATATHADECLRLVWRRSLDSVLFQGCIDLPEGSAAVDVERGFLCYECGCAAVPLLRPARGVPIVRGCTVPGILLGPWRLARCVVAVAWSFTPGRACYGTSCTRSLLASLPMGLSSRRVMMPRLRQQSCRTVLSLVPCVRRESLTELPVFLLSASMVVLCRLRRGGLAI